MGKGTSDKSLSGMLKSELLEVAKRLGLTKLSALRKDEIIDLVETAKRRLKKRKTAVVTTVNKAATKKAATKKTAAKKATTKKATTKKATAKKATTKKATTKKATTKSAATAIRKKTAAPKATKAATTNAAAAKTAKTTAANKPAVKAKSTEKAPAPPKPTKAAPARATATKAAPAKAAPAKATAAKATAAKATTAKAAAAKAAPAKAAPDNKPTRKRSARPTQAAKKSAMAQPTGRRERPSKQAAAKGSRMRPSRAQVTVNVRPPDMEQMREADSSVPKMASGDNRIALMPRDPSWMYAYWNLIEEYKVAARDAGGKTLALRVYDVTDATFDGHNPHVEHPCEEWATNWYIPVTTPGRTYLVEIGYRGGPQWYPLARSNRVQVPRDQPSPSSDVRFASIDLTQELTGNGSSDQALAAAHDAGDPPAGSLQIGRAGGSHGPYADAMAAAGSLAQVPGSPAKESGRVPGSLAQVPGSVPGSLAQVPGSQVPGSRVPGSHVAGSHVAGSGALRSLSPGAQPARNAPLAVSRVQVHGDAAGAGAPTGKPRLLQTSAELVVEGRAAPGTIVQIAGRKIAVGPDGGFFLRIPLPEGLGDLAIEGKKGRQREHLHLWFGQLTEG